MQDIIKQLEIDAKHKRSHRKRLIKNISMRRINKQDLVESFGSQVLDIF